MKSPSRVALQLLLAAGAVAATGGAASADPAPPCRGWQTAVEETQAGPIPSFAAFCGGVAEPGFKQGWPIKWYG